MNVAVRCMAVTGTVWTGPQYCGYKGVDIDDNGRPCCKRHLGDQHGVEWLGDRGRYPHGVGGRWVWRHGPVRGGDIEVIEVKP